MSGEEIYENIIRGLREKHKALTRYRNQVSWKFFQGEAPEAYKVDFDDSAWQPINLPVTFDARKGEGWIRGRITVPEEIEGIKVSRSIAKMHSSVIVDKSELYTNGEKILSADYWMELRPRIILDEEAVPGKTYIVSMHLFQKYEPVHVPGFYVTYSAIEKFAFELESFIEEIRFARLIDRNFVEKVLKDFDLSVLKGSIQCLLEEIEEARRKLSVLSSEAKKFRVHLIAHAHIDMNWLWPWKDTLNTIKSTFSTMIKLMNKYGDFHFSQSQAVTYKTVEENFPDLFESIKNYAKRGNWDITASMWVEADLNMAGTEALLRQFLYAKRYIYEKFGIKPKVCWEPDTFGHIWTLPQILRKCGIKCYYFMRCGKGHPIFWWEGPDGSRVLAFSSIYNNSIAPKNIVDLVVELYERYGLKTSMFVYGAGDHGGGATIEDIETAYEMMKKPTLPSLVFSSTHSFFEEAEREIDGRGLSIPVIRDELQFIFDGCYTTHSDIKRCNRLCETLLIDAEKVCAITGMYKKDSMRDLWLKTLFNQFHDILDGSGTAEAYIYPRKLYQEAAEAINDIINVAMKDLSRKIRFSRDGIPLIVFNTLSWDRTDIVRVRVPRNLIPKNAAVVSYNGKEKKPVQICGDEILFLANVPPTGYKVYYLIEDQSTEKTNLSTAQNSLENNYFKIELKPFSGTIKALYDKVDERFVFKEDRYPSTNPVFSNLMQILYETPHPMSAWIVGPISCIENLIKDAKIELVENGPVRATIKVSWAYRNSEITQYISLYNEIPRIDFHVSINWREVADDKTDAPMLKVSYTPILGKSRATFEIPFGYIERVADGTEYPALRWVDLSDNEYGLSIVNNCKYGFDVNGNTVRMTLVRTSYSPDPKPDYGVHEILYALYPHKGDWREALTFRVGWELNHPLITYAALNRKEDGNLPEEASFINVKPSNIIISCFKSLEDSDDLVVRVYDAAGEGAIAEIQFNFNIGEIYEADLMESPIKPLRQLDGKIQVKINPFEIKTLLLKCPQTIKTKQRI